MKTSATTRTEPRRWSRRSRAYETCNLHGEPRVQVACQPRISTRRHSESLPYFRVVTTAQTSTHNSLGTAHHLRIEHRPTPTSRKLGALPSRRRRSTVAIPARTQRRSPPTPLPLSQQASCQIYVTSSRQQPLRPLSPFPRAREPTVHKQLHPKIRPPHSETAAMVQP